MNKHVTNARKNFRSQTTNPIIHYVTPLGACYDFYIHSSPNYIAHPLYARLSVRFWGYTSMHKADQSLRPHGSLTSIFLGSFKLFFQTSARKTTPSMIPCACSMRLQLPGDLAHQAGPSQHYQRLARFKVKFYIRSHRPLLPQQRQVFK